LVKSKELIKAYQERDALASENGRLRELNSQMSKEIEKLKQEKVNLSKEHVVQVKKLRLEISKRIPQFKPLFHIFLTNEDVRDLTSLTPHVGRIIYFPCNKGQH
jgi:hypothetical protein